MPEMFHCHRTFVKDFTVNGSSIEVMLSNGKTVLRPSLKVFSEKKAIICEVRPEKYSNNHHVFNVGHFIKALKKGRFAYYLGGYHIFSIEI